MKKLGNDLKIFPEATNNFSIARDKILESLEKYQNELYKAFILSQEIIKIIEEHQK